MRRVLSLPDLSILAAASMGPAFSIASTFGVMVAVAGSATPLALAVLTFVMVPVAIAFGQLSARYPDAGSSYAWARRAFGTTVGAYAAYILLLSNFFATMAIALPAGAYTLALVAPQLADQTAWEAAVGCAWIVGCALVLRTGARPTARITAVFLAAEIAVVAVAALVASLRPAPVEILPPTPSFGGFIAAAVLGIWVVDGWELTAATSEETSGASWTAGLGGIVGLLVTAVVLLFALGAFMHVGGVAGLGAHQVDVLAYVGDRLGGAWRPVLILTVLVSLAATLATTLLYLVRSIYAMGRDGIFPGRLGRIGRSGEPNVALFAVTIAVCAATLASGTISLAASALRIVLDGSAIFLGVLFALSCLSALRLLPAQKLAALVGGIGLVVLLALAVVVANPVTRWSVGVGMALGWPFAVVAGHQRRRDGARTV